MRLESKPPQNTKTIIYFDGTNYDEWASRCYDQLMKQRVSRFVDYDYRDPQDDEIKTLVAVPGESNQDAALKQQQYKEYKTRIKKEKLDDLEAFAHIRLTVNPTYHSLISQCKSAKEAWDIIKNSNQGSSEVYEDHLWELFHATTMSEDEPIEVFIATLEKIQKDSQSCANKIPDKRLRSHVCLKANSKWDTFITGLQSQAEYSDWDWVKKQLIQQQRRFNDKDTFQATTAMYSNHQKKNQRFNYKSNNKKQTQSKRPTTPCPLCKQEGHWKSECPQYVSSQTNKHFHKHESQAKDPKSKGEASSAEGILFLTNSHSNQRDSWCIDSGASHHMTNNFHLLNHPIKLKIPFRISVAKEGQEIVATHSGSVFININDNQIKLDNVLFINKLPRNLISVSQLTSAKYTIQFHDNHCIIKDPNDKQLTMTSGINNIYTIPASYTTSNAFFSTTQPNSGSKKADINIWHQRMGHVNIQYIDQMAKCQSVNGLEIIGTDQAFCDSCAKSKLVRHSFKHSSNLFRATKAGEGLHLDLIGPMSIQSLNGNKYVLPVVDDFTRLSFVSFIKSKAETFREFQVIQQYITNQTGNKTKWIRSDNGTEFINKQFRTFTDKLGIHHYTSTPYTPELNSVVERFNRTVQESARTMLSQSKLPPSLWQEAIRAANYIRNRCMTKAHNDSITPYELFFGHKPSVGHLRIFGSIAYSHIDKKKRTKFSSNADTCALVGYTDNGYRLYDSNKRKIIESSHVIVNEKDTLDDEEEIQSDSDSDEDSNNKTKDLPTETKQLSSSQLPEQGTVSSNEQYETASEHSEASIPEANNEAVIPPEANNEAVIPSAQIRNQLSSTLNGQYWSNTPTPTRLRQRPESQSMLAYENHLQAYSLQLNSPKIPSSYQEAITSPDKEVWIEAISTEYNSLIDNKTWHPQPVDLPPNKTAIKTKWVFDLKYDQNNLPCRAKARCVAKGFTQQYGKDFTDTFSATPRKETFRILLAISVHYKHTTMEHWDVTTAFLNSTLKEEVYIQLPEGTPGHGNNKVFKLNKAIYGLKQSGRAWQNNIQTFFLDQGLLQSKSEPCLYYISKPKEYIIFLIQVDDIFCICTSEFQSKLETIKENFNKKYKNKNHGQPKQFNGFNIFFSKNEVTITQQNYIKNKVNDFNLNDVKNPFTPIQKDKQINQNNQPPSKFPYQALVGSLLYSAVSTRPDISYATSYCSRFFNDYTDIQVKQAKRILAYLHHTSDFSLKYSNNFPLQPEIYTDSDYGSDPRDRKSISGFIIKMSGAAVSWKSSKQPVVSLSSCEAEFNALALVTQEVLWISQLLSELSINISTPIIYIDNQPVISIINGNQNSKRLRHVDIRIRFVEDIIKKNFISLKYIQTTYNLADLFTKALAPQRFQQLVSQLGFESSKPSAMIRPGVLD